MNRCDLLHDVQGKPLSGTTATSTGLILDVALLNKTCWYKLRAC